MTRSERNAAILACVPLVAGIVVGGINYAFDPLQLFHRASFYPARYMTDARIQNAGLIRSQDFDTVFIGSSLAVHFRPSAIDRHLGGKSVKLAASGLTSNEARFFLEAAIRQKHPKRIIWEMDDWSFRDAPDVETSPYVPVDLYRMNTKGLARYLFSLSTLRESVGLAMRLIGLDRTASQLAGKQILEFHNDNVDEINTVPLYADVSDRFNARSAMAAYDLYKQHPERLADGYIYKVMARNFERDALSLITANPDIKFIVYVTPYSILYHVALRNLDPKAADASLKVSADILTELSKLPNVTLYDFRAVKEITHNLDNYVDLFHHSPAIDERVLEFIEHGEHRVSPDNPTASLDMLQEQVRDYEVH